MIGDVIWNAIRMMTKAERAHYRAKFTEAQWQYLTRGMPW
jgi:hypothetical protein